MLKTTNRPTNIACPDCNAELVSSARGVFYGWGPYYIRCECPSCGKAWYWDQGYKNALYEETQPLNDDGYVEWASLGYRAHGIR